MSIIDNIPIPMKEKLQKQIALHWELLTEANRHFNITAITDQETAAIKHYADCLMAMEQIRPLLPVATTICDIGSGGGFPGLLMAACWPEFPVTLLEASQKKADFLYSAAKKMGLDNVTVLAVRAEDAGQNINLRGNFTLVTARAVAEMRVLAEYALPLLIPEGILAAMKGSAARQELQDAEYALETMGGRVEQTWEYELPDAPRCLILVRKVEQTPDKYPRRPGMPTKKPL